MMTAHQIAQKLQAIEKHIMDVANDDIVDGRSSHIIKQGWNSLKEGIILSAGRMMYIRTIEGDKKQETIVKPTESKDPKVTHIN